tara:strand:+ start:542 stop:802 length:261 start_codon:yes stop_codon:yes gene_type:complete
MLVDQLGHPIEAGMTILTNGYYSSGNHMITKVVRVTKKAVIIHVNKYDWQKQTEIPNHTLRRDPCQVFVIEKQLAYNQETFPEYSL